MKEITMSRGSWLIRFAFLIDKLEDGYIAARTTSICAIFWRVIFTMLVGFLLVVLSPLWVPILGIVLLQARINRTRAGRTVKEILTMDVIEVWNESVIGQWFIDWKNKTCTRVELV